jgi:hypothetical protein
LVRAAYLGSEEAALEEPEASGVLVEEVTEPA